jgi:hypothetical protein
VADLKRLGRVDRGGARTSICRVAAAQLEARFREARDVASRWLGAGAHKQWQAQCDVLAARLALCEEREQAPATGDLAERWAAQGALPSAWEQALAQRRAQPAEAGPLPGPAFDELLLQLEAALDLPASPESLAARRELKLRALKDALEAARR